MSEVDQAIAERLEELGAKIDRVADEWIDTFRDAAWWFHYASDAEVEGFVAAVFAIALSNEPDVGERLRAARDAVVVDTARRLAEVDL